MASKRQIVGFRQEQRSATTVPPCTTGCRAMCAFFFFQAEDGIRDYKVTGVQTCALPIYWSPPIDAPACLRGLRASARAGGQGSAGLFQSGDRRHDALVADHPSHQAVAGGDRKSVVVGEEGRSRWSPDH